MAEERGALKQSEFNSRDRVYALIPLRPMKPNQVTTIVAGLHKKKVVKAEVERSNPHLRITLTLDDQFQFTCRFRKDALTGQLIAVINIPWAKHNVFDSAEQFATQYLEHLKTGKKQKGVRQSATMPLFAEATA